MRYLVRPEVPKGNEKNVVDRFVQAKQKELGLIGAKEADRRVLARRLAFDLWGMPLESAKVEAFVKNDREGAYE